MKEQIKSGIEAETKAYWMERALRAEGLVERMMTDPPAQMFTLLGLLSVLTGIATDLCLVEHDLERLKRLL